MSQYGIHVNGASPTRRPRVAHNDQPARMRVRLAPCGRAAQTSRTARAVPPRMPAKIGQDRPCRLATRVCSRGRAGRALCTGGKTRSGKACLRTPPPPHSAGGAVWRVVPNTVFQNSNLETRHMPPGQTREDAPSCGCRGWNAPRRKGKCGSDRRTRRGMENRPRIAPLECRSAAWRPRAKTAPGGGSESVRASWRGVSAEPDKHRAGRVGTAGRSERIPPPTWLVKGACAGRAARIRSAGCCLQPPPPRTRRGSGRAAKCAKAASARQRRGAHPRHADWDAAPASRRRGGCRPKTRPRAPRGASPPPASPPVPFAVPERADPRVREPGACA